MSLEVSFYPHDVYLEFSCIRVGRRWKGSSTDWLSGWHRQMHTNVTHLTQSDECIIIQSSHTNRRELEKDYECFIDTSICSCPDAVNVWPNLLSKLKSSPSESWYENPSLCFQKVLTDACSPPFRRIFLTTEVYCKIDIAKYYIERRLLSDKNLIQL